MHGLVGRNKALDMQNTSQSRVIPSPRDGRPPEPSAIKPEVQRLHPPSFEDYARFFSLPTPEEQRETSDNIQKTFKTKAYKRLQLMSLV